MAATSHVARKSLFIVGAKRTPFGKCWHHPSYDEQHHHQLAHITCMYVLAPPPPHHTSISPTIPTGAFGGKLKGFSATELAFLASKAALAEAKVDPKLVNAVFAGNVIQSSTDACYLSRHVGLKSGVPQHVPALTINR